MDVNGSFEEKEKVQEMALSIHFSEACAVVLMKEEKASSENKAKTAGCGFRVAGQTILQLTLRNIFEKFSYRNSSLTSHV